MPELPEVETTLRGIYPHINGATIDKVLVKENSLRWKISESFEHSCKNSIIKNIRRRAKYLLIGTDKGTIIIHLGMSGTLRVVNTSTPLKKHDHVVFSISTNCSLRFNDPRRFGAVLWTESDPLNHKLLKELGPEPLTEAFTGKYIYDQFKNRKTCVKQLLMNSKIVVGVGNIYASESLFAAGIHPQRIGSTLLLLECEKLSVVVKQILKSAIKAGGTTLKDFTQSDGNPGYFAIKLKVYGKDNLPCFKCKTTIQKIIINQRNSWFCPQCQK